MHRDEIRFITRVDSDWGSICPRKTSQTNYESLFPESVTDVNIETIQRFRILPKVTPGVSPTLAITWVSIPIAAIISIYNATMKGYEKDSYKGAFGPYLITIIPLVLSAQGLFMRIRAAKNAKPNTPESSLLKPWRLNMSYYLSIAIVTMAWITLIMGAFSLSTMNPSSDAPVSSCVEGPTEVQKNFAKFTCSCNPVFVTTKCPEHEVDTTTSTTSVSCRRRLSNSSANSNSNTNSSSSSSSSSNGNSSDAPCKVFNEKYRTCEESMDPACSDCGHCHHTQLTYFMGMMVGLIIEVLLGLALYIVSWQCVSKEEAAQLLLEITIENARKKNVWLTFKMGDGILGFGNKCIMLSLNDAKKIRTKFFKLQTQFIRRAKFKIYDYPSNKNDENKDLFVVAGETI